MYWEDLVSWIGESNWDTIEVLLSSRLERIPPITVHYVEPPPGSVIKFERLDGVVRAAIRLKSSSSDHWTVTFESDYFTWDELAAFITEPRIQR
jgi:hypothetical protein